AAAVSALLGLVIGAPTLRVRGDYLAIITLGFGEIIPVAIRNLGDITIEIGSWRPIERLNLTGGENGVNPVGRPYLPGVPFETDPVPWYFLILVIGAASLWAMNRLRDSRLGRAWMAIREDETAADCMGVNPISTKLLAFALGASFSGFAGSVYAAKLQAITPGAFEFQVSIMLLCMVVLGGAGSLKGVILGGMLITVFDRVVLTQTTFMVRAGGRAAGVAALTTADLTLWRWFFFGLGLVLVMLLRPEGLAGRRLRPVAVDADDAEDPMVLEPPPPPRAEAIPRWLRDRAPRGAAADPRVPILEVRGVVKQFGGVVALNEVDLLVPHGAIIGLIGPNGAGKTTFFNVVTGLIRPHGGHEPARDRGAHRADRALASGALAVGAADRARHGGGHGDLRSDHRARLRHAHRRGHARGDPASPQGDRSLPGHRRGAGPRGPRPLTVAGVLELADVHTYYGNIRALRGVSLGVSTSEIVTLIGANGAGKTTTLRTILGTVRPHRGTVSFNGHRLDTLTTNRIVRLGIAQSPEGRRIFPRMTVLENLELGAFVRPDREAIAPDLERVFTLFPRLRERSAQKGGTLSGGEQQMLAIGRALMARPALLLLDEPSMGLSPILVDTIFRIVQDINRQGTTILLVEQNARMALRVAHRGYVIQTGRIVLHDAAAALLR